MASTGVDIFDVTVVETSGFITLFETSDSREFSLFKEQARKKAEECIPLMDMIDEKYRHLVYYYELQPNQQGKIEVRIEMNPQLVTENDFEAFVAYWKPLYVGAIHRR